MAKRARTRTGGVGKTRLQSVRNTNSAIDSNKKRKKSAKAQPHPRAIAIADRAIKTASDYTQTMIALLTETLRGHVTPQICNAAVGAGTRAMRSVELELRYGDRFRKTFQNHMQGVIDVASDVPLPKAIDGPRTGASKRKK